MQIGAVGTGYYQPYVYNTNSLSRTSMKPVQGIGDDLLTSKTDFSALTDDAKQNVNPLKRGETADFAGIVDMQMQMGRMNASRVMDVDPFADQAVRNVYENMNDGARAMQAESALDVTA